MKILIGTPIHESKNYAMERWLQNVAEMRAQSPASFLMVDSSYGTAYVEKVKGYCEKLGIQDYKIEHVEIERFQPYAEKIGRSREIIRKEILKNNYDAWLSWENDKIVPADTLAKLVKIMEAGNYMIIHPNSWTRVLPGEPPANFDVCLIRRLCLEKYGFSLEYPDMPNCWAGGEERFKKQVLKGGGNYIEVYGLIKPMHHLNDSNKSK